MTVQTSGTSDVPADRTMEPFRDPTAQRPPVAFDRALNRRRSRHLPKAFLETSSRLAA
jgi:hypothetical protein